MGSAKIEGDRNNSGLTGNESEWSLGGQAAEGGWESKTEGDLGRGQMEVVAEGLDRMSLIARKWSGLVERETNPDLEILSGGSGEVYINQAADKLVEYVAGNRIQNLVLGISGGLDSAVVAGLCLEAIGRLNERGIEVGYKMVFLDVESKPGDLEKAKELADKFGFVLEYGDLNQWYQANPLNELTPETEKKSRVAAGNVKCRLRMVTLYDLANKMNGLVMDTDDFSELLMGFWTRHGDEGDVKLTQHVTKSEMRDIAKIMGVPESITSAAPGDGLGVTESNKASDQLYGLDYLAIEYIMSRFVGEGFLYNGDFVQLEEQRFQTLVESVAGEIGLAEEGEARVKGILAQALRTRFKRVGESAVDLMPEREEFGFLKFGSGEFNEKYLEAWRPRRN